MDLKYIDAHGHPQFAAYDSDRELVISRALDAGVGMIAIGTDIVTSKSAIELAEKYDGVWASIGMHPVYAGESHSDSQETGINDENKRPRQEFAREEFVSLAKNPKVVAVGECGLDYFHLSSESIDLERDIFIEQIKIANEIGKPLMLHIRNGKENGNAYKDATLILKEYAKVKANFHFFAGDNSDLKEIIDAGHFVSYGGVITFAKNYEELVKNTPIDRILIETDCPYVSPVPYRGKRNEPVYVIEVAKKMAEIRGEDEEMVREKILENTKRFFGI